MKKTGFYILYSLAVLLVFGYLLFPGRTISDYLQSQVAQKGNGMELSMGGMGLALPLGLEMRDVKVSSQGQTLFTAGRVKVTPGLRLLIGKPAFSVKMKCYGGTIKLSMNSLERNLQGPVSVRVQLSGVNPKDMGLFTKFTGRTIAGTVDGEASYQGQIAQWTKGTGSAAFTLTEGKMEMLADLIGINSFSVTKATAEAELSQGTLAIKKCEMEGRELSGSLAGKVALAEPVTQSRVDINGKVTPAPALFQQLGSSSPVTQMLRSQMARTGSIPFSITGTLGANEVAFH
ncbi:MAG: type II secretion system protein GspN [Thermodesulfobacteriota bacterium]